MNRLAWLQERQKGLGGSDLGQIPSIVRAVGGDPKTDCSPWGDEWKVWASKTAGPAELVAGERHGEENDAMLTGNLLEPVLAQWAADQLGGERVFHGSSPPSYATKRAPLRGNPDDLLLIEHELEGVECKVDDTYGWDEIPFYYRLQGMAYLALTRAVAWHFAVFHRKAPAWRLYKLERNRDLEESMLEAVREWWQLRIIDGEPPDIDDTAACSAHLVSQHPRTAGSSFGDFRVATEREIRRAEELDRFERLELDVVRDRKRAQNLLRAAIGDAPGIRWTGGSARWSRNRLTLRIQDQSE